jgi:hypothetical protein
MMTRHDPAPRSPRPAPRIVVTHIAGRLWTARTQGRGCGAAWGTALAALDCRSHAVTLGHPSTWWIDQDALQRLIVEAGRIGVRVEAADGAQLPTASVR